MLMVMLSSLGTLVASLSPFSIPAQSLPESETEGGLQLVRHGRAHFSP